MDYQMIIKLHEIWMTINLKVEKHIYKLFFIFKIFFLFIYMSIIKIVNINHCQPNPFSWSYGSNISKSVLEM
jgi:hypothetical protein